MGAQLMIEWEGDTYAADPQTKAPILELFGTDETSPPSRRMAPIKPGGLVWKAAAGPPMR